MNIDIDRYNLDEIKRGYIYEPDEKRYVCLECGAVFESGEIFNINSRLYEASRAIEIHIKNEHGSRFSTLINSDLKYNDLTENQKELLLLMHSGLSDSEIAKKTGVAASTVRHQRFTFREKAKRARMYLAVYETAIENQKAKEALVSIHDSARMVDDRYATTEEESDKIIQNAFESLSPLKLKTFPAREKKKLVVLRKISAQFEKGRVYSEKEVNQILGSIYEDFATIRRYLIEYGFMERTTDCTEYMLH